MLSIYIIERGNIMKKRIIALIICILLLVTVIPITVSAGTAIAQIGSTSYDSLADAIAAVPTDGTATTIKMVANDTIEGNAGITIASGQNITLDLNGCTITHKVTTDNKASQAIDNQGILTVKDSAGSGLITNEIAEGINPGDPAGGKNYTTNLIENNGTFTIESGSLVNTGAGSACYAIDNNSADGHEISCTINGGLLKNVNYTPVRIAPTKSKSVTFVMTDGTIEGLYGLVLNCNSSEAPMVSITISGGTIKAKDYAFYTSGAGNVNDKTNAKISITGGTFGNGTPTGGLIHLSPFTEFILGGTYTESPATEYLVDGVGVVQEGDLYVVGGKPAIDFRLPTDATEDTQAASEEIQKTAEALVEATKDEDTKLEDAIDKDAVIEQAEKGDVLVTTYIDIGLVSATKDGAEFEEITFDVTPIAVIFDTGSKEVAEVVIPNELIEKDVTVRLPLPDSFKGKTVSVFHEGEFLCDTEVISDDLGCYIEFDTGSFSKYSVKEAPEKPDPTPTPTPAPTPDSERIADTADASQALGSAAFCVASILCIAAIEKRKREI